jgi:metallophosphoesterase superfamily enzyme
VVRLGPRRGSGRVPVFWQRPAVFVLPSFGSFTGGADVVTGHGDILFAVAPERVVAFPPSAP